jgi:ATP-binding cassette subfamily B (MDR/TAP) protein 1
MPFLAMLLSLLVCVAAARTSSNLKQDFLDKLLRQDVANFDKDNSGLLQRK